MYRRALTIQDISCVGQCSLTVALPIMSACGVETAILPSAVLSTHTAGFTGFTVRDLADDIPAISAHWQKEGLDFAAVYTGYLGSVPQIDMVLEIMDHCLQEGGLRIVDPAMGDNGRLYPAFDMEYVEAMKRLVGAADYTLPNITEAAFLTGMEYCESYDQAYVKALMDALQALGAKNVIITGASFSPDTTGVMVRENGTDTYYEHRKISESRHGTGDIYSSAFAGALIRGKSAYEAAVIAADFTVAALEETLKGEPHLYGAKFELVIPKLIEMLR